MKNENYELNCNISGNLIIDRYRVFTNMEFKKLVIQFAKKLSTMTYKNSLIAIIGKNTTLTLISLLASIEIESSIMLIDPSLQQEEILRICTRTKPHLLIDHMQKYDFSFPLIDQNASSRIFQLSNNKNYIVNSVIQITSGSTGESKIVKRSFSSIHSEIIESFKEMYFSENETFLCISPIVHSFGLVSGCLLPYFFKKNLILIDEFFPGEILDICKKNSVDVIFAAPYMYHLLGKYMTNDISQNIKGKCISAGATLNKEIVYEFYKKTNVEIWNDYGSTETGLLCLNKNTLSKPESIGKPIKKCHLLTGGNDFKSERENEVVIYCPWLESEYIDGSTTKISMAYHTGDLGIVDEDGNIFLTRRIDDIINIYGKKASSSEIEKFIEQIDFIEKCVVISSAYYKGGRIVAFIKTCKEPFDLGDVIKYCQKSLPDYKIPREIYVLKDIPTSKTGKTLKKYLLNELLERSNNEKD